MHPTGNELINSVICANVFLCEQTDKNEIKNSVHEWISVCSTIILASISDHAIVSLFCILCILFGCESLFIFFLSINILIYCNVFKLSASLFLYCRPIRLPFLFVSLRIVCTFVKMKKKIEYNCLN